MTLPPPPPGYNYPATQKPQQMTAGSQLALVVAFAVIGAVILIGGAAGIAGFAISGDRPLGRGALGFPLLGIFGGLTLIVSSVVLGIRLAIRK